jgi:Holliday junction resolvase
MIHKLKPAIQEALSKELFSRGGRTQRVARAGEYFVVAELNKHGAYAVRFAGNMPKINVMACNHDQTRTIHIQVKTKRGGRVHLGIG